jgi:hypothetical protein
VETRLVDTPVGPARLHRHSARGPARATLVLGHGAGGGVAAPDLEALAATLPGEGVDVVLVEQPWWVRGARVAGHPATLDAAWVAALADLAARALTAGRLVVGGRSTGARVACRTVHEVRPAGLLLLAFPLRPPSAARSRPDQPRAPESALSPSALSPSAVDAGPASVPAPLQGGARGAARGPRDGASRGPAGPSPGGRAIGPAESLRARELVGAAVAVPTVVVQGTRDAFGSDLAVREALAGTGATVVGVPFADHAFRVPARSGRSPRDALDDVVAAARAAVVR